MSENVTFRAETRPDEKKERPKELAGIVFAEVLKKDGKREYKSSEPGRKIIILSGSSPSPEPGQPYRVKIIEDTDPENPESGKFIAEIIPETTDEDPIFETETSISYLGVTLEKAKNTEDQSVPKREKYADYINDRDLTLPLQRDLAISFSNGDPYLGEGGTSLGKTTTVRKMAAELGWEVHYVQFNEATDVEDFMGRYIPNPFKIDRTKITDEQYQKIVKQWQAHTAGMDPTALEAKEYIFADGKVTSGLRQEEGKIKVIILDEINAAPPNILIRLHEVLDAIERGENIILSEDASEAVTVDKAKTKIVAFMNPPGKGYLGLKALSPAQLRRWVYKKLPSELPEGTFSHATKSLFFGKEQEGQKITPDMFLHPGEQLLTKEQLEEIPGIHEIEKLYEEFHKGAKELLKNRKIAEDQPQPFTFDDRMEPRRVRDFILRFYRGDINKTFQQALRYYYADKLESQVDKKKIGESIRLVEYKPKVADSKRKGLERGERTTSPEKNIITIDRSQPFNPGLFIGSGWMIEEENQESLALSEVDLSQVLFESMLNRNEWSITGEEKIRRLKKANHVFLDAKIFQTLWENQQLIPESWKEKGHIFFDGTIFRYLGASGNRGVLELEFHDREWHKSCRWLTHNQAVIDGPSAFLAKHPSR